jgi:hypothetical protein
MAETPYTQPRRPNVIKRHKSDAFQNPNSNWFKMTAGFGFFSGYILSQLNNYPDYEMFLVAGALAIGLMWLKLCGLSPRRADKSMVKFSFFVSEIRGKHVMHKLTSKNNDLRTVYPLKKIHKGGLIQFIGKEYGVLLKLHPKRIADEDRDDHQKKIKGMVDGLGTGRHFKIIACSKVNPRKEIIDHLMEVANKTGSKERAEHLNGILLKLMGDQSQVMMYRHYAFLGLGKHDSLESAEIAKGAILEGLLLNMKRASLQPQTMENEREIRNAYREMSSERVIF